jgi:hypothetical protein
VETQHLGNIIVAEGSYAIMREQHSRKMVHSDQSVGLGGVPMVKGLLKGLAVEIREGDGCDVLVDAKEGG